MNDLLNAKSQIKYYRAQRLEGLNKLLLKDNPALTVRRVLDELVRINDNLYLGTAHVRWWWRPADGWQTVAYFKLTRT